MNFFIWFHFILGLLQRRKINYREHERAKELKFLCTKHSALSRPIQWSLISITNKTIEMKKVRTLLRIWFCAGGTIWFIPSTVALTRCNLLPGLKTREEEEEVGHETHWASETIIIVSRKLLILFPSASFFFFLPHQFFRQTKPKQKHH